MYTEQGKHIFVIDPRSQVENEILMIEFQGTIHFNCEEISSKLLGNMNFDQQTKTYSLLIGINQLKGKEVELERPLVLTKRNPVTNDTKELIVEGIVRKKILFSVRPTPLMEKSFKKAKSNFERQ